MVNEWLNERRQWDDDGGSQLRALAVSRGVDRLDEEDKLILEFLEISLLILRDDLPIGEQQKVLNAQAIRSAFDKAEIKSRMQRLDAYLRQGR